MAHIERFNPDTDLQLGMERATELLVDRKACVPEVEIFTPLPRFNIAEICMEFFDVPQHLHITAAHGWSISSVLTNQVRDVVTISRVVTNVEPARNRSKLLVFGPKDYKLLEVVVFRNREEPEPNDEPLFFFETISS